MNYKIEDLIDEWTNTDNCMDETREKIEELLKKEDFQYEIYSDCVFDSPGYDLYMLYVSWVDCDGTLRVKIVRREHC